MGLFPRCTFALLMGTALISCAQTRDRLPQRIDDGEFGMLQGNVHPLARPEFDQGRMDGQATLNGVSLVFKLSPSQQLALEKLLAAQQDRQSPNYHRWLTPEQYAARFGMTDSDIAKVAVWLRTHGFAVDEISRNRTYIVFSGTVDQTERTFQTEMHRYLVHGQMHFANSTELTIPAALDGAVAGVRRLNDFRPEPRVHVRKLSVEASPRFTSHISGNHFLAPADFATIYDLNPLYSAGFDGTGAKLAVAGQTAIALSDIRTFRTASSLPPGDPQVIVVPNSGTPVVTTGDIDEANLDIEWSGAVARNANVLYVTVGNSANFNVFDSLHYAVINKIAPVISISYGYCDTIQATETSILSQLAQEASSQGQTITAASGDTGAAGCEDLTAKIATTGLSVGVPASIPEVTGVGGTEFNGDGPGTVTGTPPNTNASATTYWSGTTNSADTVDSALSYIPEMVWNDSPQTGTKLSTTLSAGGGGISNVFSKPGFQAALTPSDGKRDVPDVSLNASADHDPYLLCTQGSCVVGFRSSPQGSFAAAGGTSAGAPAMAGIITLINQATQSAGQGNANVNLYALKVSNPNAFNDIMAGNNIVPCTQGSKNCPATAPFQIGYPAGTNYDVASGLGSIDAHNLVTAWPGFVATPSFSVGGTVVTIASPGNPGTSTITVDPTNGFAGTVDLSCTPPPSSSLITCSLSTSSVTVNASSATATLTVTTTPPHALNASSIAGFGWLAAATGMLFAGIVTAGAPRERRWTGICALAILVCLGVGVACGGRSSSAAPQTLTGGTPKGNYTITVTGTSGTITSTSVVEVTVN